MSNSLEVFKAIFLSLDKLMGLPGSLVTIYDHFKAPNHIEETLKVMREKAGVAYAQYCEYRKYRENDLGIPLEKDILGYWESCLKRGVLPGAGDMEASNIASREEAEIMIFYLMEQWMTVPEFSLWLHGILNQNQMEELSDRLADLSQISEAINQMRAELEMGKISNIATLLSPGCIYDAKCSCNVEDIKNYYTVDNNFHTMLRVISAEEDVPNLKAEQAVMERIQNGTPVIITGIGGQGKTSLMMRAAIKWASSGHLTVLMTLSNSEIITPQKAEQFFDCLMKATPEGQRVLLCIDNPFEGKESFFNLQKGWQRNNKIQLLLVERENRLTRLADSNRDLLLYWFDNSEVIVLQGINQIRQYYLKDYSSYAFPESQKRRNAILEKGTSYLVKDGVISREKQISVTKLIRKNYEKPNVSLVEAIYRTLFELKKVASKPGSIKLDWEEWNDFINQEFGNVDSMFQLYGVIAALKVFDIPLPLSLFCKYFQLEERKLRNRLQEQFVPRHVEPVVYQETARTLQPKHDVIAELFFLFNGKKVTINSLIEDLLDVMNENETEKFLEHIVNKRELKKGSEFPAGEITYWNYMESIYCKIQRGNFNLSPDGRAYLCLGILWTRKQREKNSLEIGTILENIAPEIEDNFLMTKLYTEWGIWAVENNNNSLAEEKFLTVIKNTSEHRQLPARTELGRLLSRQKDRKKEAEKILRKAIGIAPHDIPSRTELGRLLSWQNGREEEAERLFHEIIALDARNIQARTELGRLLSRQIGREEEAEKFLREAIKIDPENLHPHTELGRLLSRQKGREEEAEEFLLEAIRIYPKHLHSRDVLAKLYERMGRISEARKLYREICSIDPQNKYGKEGLARLKNR